MRKITFLILIIVAGVFSAEYLSAAETKKPSVPVVPVVQPVSMPQPSVTVPENAYSYNPVGKPDPFRPFVEGDAAVKKKEEKKSISSIFPLQREEAEKFRVVGIAGEQSRRIAVVEDAAKKYYPLFIGTHIGTNNGKVIEILPDRVIIEEQKTKKGKRIILKLHKIKMR